MRRIVFADLDDTLFQSLAKLEPVPGMRPTARLSDGTWHSFMTQGQKAFFDWLVLGADVVPVTGRSPAGLQRVDLPFHHGAVVHHGGLVLDSEGQLDPAWMDLMHPALAASRDDLLALSERLVRRAASHFPGVRVRLMEDHGLAFYISLKPTDPRAKVLEVDEFLDGVSLPLDFWQHRNGPNVALLPGAVRKERAVAWIIDRLRLGGEEIVTVGIGDSHSDLPFLLRCDYAMVPKSAASKSGQLWEALADVASLQR